MGMDVVDLINHFKLEDPCDEYCVLRASDENAPPPRDEFADEGEAADKGEGFEREPMEEDDLKTEPMEEEDPKEEFNEGGKEIIGEKTPRMTLRKTLRKTLRRTLRRAPKRILRRVWRRRELSLLTRFILRRSLRTLELRVGYLRQRGMSIRIG